MTRQERKARIYGLTIELQMLLRQELGELPGDTIETPGGDLFTVSDDHLIAWPAEMSLESARRLGLIVDATLDAADPGVRTLPPEALWIYHKLIEA